jgi:hypothetical protein
MTTGAQAGPLVIAKFYGQESVATHIELKADYVAIPIRIEADYKNPIDRISAIEKARISLVKAVEKHTDLSVKPGVVSLSPNEKASFSFKSYSRGSDVRIYIFGELSENNSIFSQTKRILDVVDKTRLPDDVDIRMEETSLAIRDPEKYRPELLKKIAKSILETKSSLGASGKVNVSGLENSVSVMQINETEVSLSIRHQIEIEM